jgi:hypothetical protein
MLLDKIISVKIAKYNIEHYKKFFDVNLGDIIDVDVEMYLQKGSNKKLNVQCDLCGEERYIKYQAYVNNKERNENFNIYTCDKCSHIKLKDTNKKKYGVDYYSQHEERNDRVKNSSIKKYGVEHYSKTKEYRDRVNKTCLEKFGYENPFMDRDLITKSLIDKYGVDNPSKVKEFRDAADISHRNTKENNGSWIDRNEKSDWELYKSIVRAQTRKNAKLMNWDGYDFYDGSYIKDNFSLHCYSDDYPTIDHKISIFDGFVNNISTHVISSVDNLCWTKRIINVKKNKKSYI